MAVVDVVVISRYEQCAARGTFEHQYSGLASLAAPPPQVFNEPRHFQPPISSSTRYLSFVSLLLKFLLLSTFRLRSRQLCYAARIRMNRQPLALDFPHLLVVQLPRSYPHSTRCGVSPLPVKIASPSFHELYFEVYLNIQLYLARSLKPGYHQVQTVSN